MSENKLNFELQYANALQNILDNGVLAKNRTGTDTLVIQHQYFFLENISFNFPIIKGKKVFPKLALKELMWMMNGRSDVKWLQDRGVNYWDEWASDEIKTPHIQLGSIGKSYGYQMRSFNKHDQLSELLKNIVIDPMSRRLIISLWNSSELNQTTLPPCVYDYHFECEKVIESFKEKYPIEAYDVSLHVKARSEDSFLGQPYDFMSVGWMLEIICHLASRFSGRKYYAKNIHYTADNFHMYVNHTEQVLQYIKNVEENKNNVINSQANIAIGNDISNDIDSFLKFSDNEKYKNFCINKFYVDVYDTILAPIAI
jgi:thymidylate synthase